MQTELNWGVELLRAMPTFIVGLIAARISWQQATTSSQQREIAEAKLKLDLFEKRLAIYETVYRIAESARDYKDIAEAKESMKILIKLSHEASFLFGKDVDSLVTEMCFNVAELAKTMQATIEAGEVPSELIPKIKEANTWLKNAPIYETFKPYLEMSAWK